MINDITLQFDTEGVDWRVAADIFEKAPLGTREPESLKRAYENSDLVCFARDGDRLIGMARALSDGVYQSVIYDLCMFPEYQRRSIGTRMMREILDRLDTPNAVLWSVPGKEPFYAAFGFAPMLTAMARFENPAKSAAQGYIIRDIND